MDVRMGRVAVEDWTEQDSILWGEPFVFVYCYYGFTE